MDEGMDVGGVVLAGGRGRRLGEPKMRAEIEGRPLLHIALDAVGAADLPAVVVAKADSDLPPVSSPVLVEPGDHEHPLLGIVTALREQPHISRFVVLGGDLPFVPPALLRALAEAPGPLVPVAAGRPQPLVARYDRVQLPALEDALAQDASLTATVRALGAATLEGLRLAQLDPSGHAFLNVNTQDDLQRARVLAQASSRRQ